MTIASTCETECKDRPLPKAARASVPVEAVSVSNENTEEDLRESLDVYTPSPAASAAAAAAFKLSISLACVLGSLLPLTCMVSTAFGRSNTL